MRNEPRNIEKETLPNGLVVISEPMEHVRSVSVGVWVRTGSRREPSELNGITHFIEHMVFKGTERRSAEEIARSVDSVGGMLDAFTAKEMICFNAKVLDEHLPIAFDVLSDLVLHPRFNEDDLAREKSVVLEEIKMDQDNPDYLVHEIFTQNFWRNHPLGKPILGTRKTVSSFTRAPVAECFRRWFAPENMIISAAGHLEHQQLRDLVAREFGQMKPSGDHYVDSAPVPQARITTKSKGELEQVHLCIGVPSYPMVHARRYGIAVLNNILGGGMSSRLFQNIRERQGLAYAVFSELSPYRDTGVLSIYAGTALERAGQVVRSVTAEFSSLKEQLVSEEELRRAKDHLKGSLMLSLESTSSRMSNLARQEMYFGKFFTLDEIITCIEAVSREEVRDIAREFFQPEQISVTVLGNLNGFHLTREQLAC
ncbi:MAG: insulinase family protein [Acidobacteria bacterium]|nr:insulinase family protein [Acidobacteriota bacterium]MBI3661898.1 insulinase family protein [Acidobacteriota bacterium]